MDWKKTKIVPPPIYTDLLICYPNKHPHGGDLIIVAYLDGEEKGSGVWRDPLTNGDIELTSGDYKGPTYWSRIPSLE